MKELYKIQEGENEEVKAQKVNEEKEFLECVFAYLQMKTDRKAQGFKQKSVAEWKHQVAHLERLLTASKSSLFEAENRVILKVDSIVMEHIQNELDEIRRAEVAQQPSMSFESQAY